MADNTPSVPTPGGVPPKPAEAAKVQPKKETVRINLPPKPTASPTIKLPALPTGPAAAPAAPAAAPAAAPVAAKAPAPPTPPATTTAKVAGPAAVAKPAAPAVPAVAARPVVVASGVSGLDKGLAIAVAIISLATLAGVFLIMQALDKTS